MKKLISIITFLALILGQFPALAIPRATDKAHLESKTNLLENPGFENGKSRWSPTGSSTLTLETGSPLVGKSSGVWNPSASGEFLDSSLLVITEELEGNLCQSKLKYKWEGGVAGEITLEVHNGTNTIVAPVDLVPTTGFVLTVTTPIYSCPGSGSMKLRLASTADAAALTIDKLHLGDALDINQVGSAELVADAKYIGTSGCIWTTTSTSFADLGAVAACPGITVLTSTVAVNTADDDLPTLVFDNLPPGNYVVTAGTTISNSSGAAGMALRISDGTTNGPGKGVTVSASVSTVAYPIAVSQVFNYTTADARTFKLQGLTTAPTFQIRNEVVDLKELHWTVTRYPLNSAEALNLNTQGFLIDVSIAGGSIPLGLSSDGSFVVADDSGLTMSLNDSSKSALISCSGTNDSTGLTCSSGNEQFGIAIPKIPFAGEWEICGYFSVFLSVSSSGSIVDLLKWAKTTNTSQTIEIDGDFVGSTAKVGGSTTGSNSRSQKITTVCETFTLNSVENKATFRLFKKATVNGTVDINQILLGSSPARITFRSLTQGFPLPVIFNTVSSSAQQGKKICSIRYFMSAGTPTLDDGDSCVSSLTDNAVGDTTVNFVAGTWTNSPKCVCTGEGGANPGCNQAANSTTSSGRFQTVIPPTGASTDVNVHVICIGDK